MSRITRDQAIARADAMLESVIADYPKILEATLAEMATLAAAEDWERLYIAAHDLKGQAGTCGWPVIGSLARSLDAAFQTQDESHFAEASKVHLDCMRLCLAHDVRLPNAAIESFLEELGDLVERMRKNTEEGAEGGNGA